MIFVDYATCQIIQTTTFALIRYVIAVVEFDCGKILNTIIYEDCCSQYEFENLLENIINHYDNVHVIDVNIVDGIIELENCRVEKSKLKLLKETVPFVNTTWNPVHHLNLNDVLLYSSDKINKVYLNMIIFKLIINENNKTTNNRYNCFY